MKKVLTSAACSVFIFILILYAVPAMATPFSFNLSAGGDFGTGSQGLDQAATKDGLTLTLTALTMIPDGTDPIYPTTAGTAVGGGSITTTTGFYGTVYIDLLGAGVNGWEIKDVNFKNPLNIDGSPGISGSGKHEDEALIFSFSAFVSIAGAKVWFNDYDKVADTNKDDSALIYFGSPVSDGQGITFGTSTIESLLVLENPSTNLYSLALDQLGLPSTFTFTQMIVRNDGGTGDDGKEFFVSSVSGDTSTPVPEPATMLLLGSGLLGLAGFARKKFKK